MALIPFLDPILRIFASLTEWLRLQAEKRNTIAMAKNVIARLDVKQHDKYNAIIAKALNGDKDALIELTRLAAE